MQKLNLYYLLDLIYLRPSECNKYYSWQHGQGNILSLFTKLLLRKCTIIHIISSCILTRWHVSYANILDNNNSTPFCSAYVCQAQF